MKILHFSTEDITGGAAKAAHRLHSALRAAGHQSRMVVLHKKSEDDDVIQAPPPPPQPIRSRVERLRRHIPGLRRKPLLSTYTFNFDLEPETNLPPLLDSLVESPDILCLHWVSGLLNVAAIRRLYDRFRCPIVWVMADQDPMTGGCHYSFGCDGYTRQCGRCPQLNSSTASDRSHLTWMRKKQDLTGLPICFVAPTSWGRERLRQSSLFQKHRVERIPYPVDTQTFRPFSRAVARDLLHLPQTKKIAFFGATYLDDPRKGMTQLIEALRYLGSLLENHTTLNKEDVYLLVAGLNGKALLNRLSLSGKYVGHLNDDVTLALAYQAADVFICPSVEDAGPMMIPESMLCGTPVAAFNAGGAPDLVETMKTGYLVQMGDVQEFADGILRLLAADNGKAIRDAAYQSALEAHEPARVIEQHVALYHSLIAETRK